MHSGRSSRLPKEKIKAGNWAHSTGITGINRLHELTTLHCIDRHSQRWSFTLCYYAMCGCLFRFFDSTVISKYLFILPCRHRNTCVTRFSKEINKRRGHPLSLIWVKWLALNCLLMHESPFHNIDSGYAVCHQKSNSDINWSFGFAQDTLCTWRHGHARF